MGKNNFNQCVSLLKKYLAGELNGAEELQLKEMMKDRYLREVFHSLQEREQIRERLEKYGRYDADAAYHRFSCRQKKIRHRKIGWRISVAAAVVLLLLGVGWLFEFRLPEKPNVPLVQNEIIQPGNHKAILCLASGERINFDRDSMNIKEENGTRIRYADGKISYEPVSEAMDLIYNELIVPTAGECYITLEDNTKVWVNADSRLKYPVRFTATDRKVWLEGEAYFDVAKDGRPFQVVTPQGEVTVLGTAFGVNAYAGGSEYTTLVHGRVRYMTHTRESVLLLPGEQAVVDPEGKLSSRKVEVEEYVSWKDGLFIFRDKPLGEIMETLARWYGVDVIFGSEEVKQLKYTGNLERYDTINAFLQVLQKLEDVHYEIEQNTIVLKRNK